MSVSKENCEVGRRLTMGIGKARRASRCSRRRGTRRRSTTRRVISRTSRPGGVSPSSVFVGCVFTFANTAVRCAGHYIENTGNGTLRFLEIFNTDRFEDVSLAQWLALTPRELVKEHLQLSDSTIAGLNKTKGVVVGGRRSASS